jgi:4-hydroxy-tetrahydrodipicolinate reductase
MGRVIRKLVAQDRNFEIVAGIDAKNTSEALIFPAYTDFDECQMTADAIIDFSAANAVMDLLRYGVKMQTPMVICTTGLSPECKEEIEIASEKVAVFRSANMSLGINLLAKVLGQITGILEEIGFDIEILEKHHGKKVDAPSGTALLLADVLNHDGRYAYITDRTTARVMRSKNEIGIASIRGGTIVGEHSVIFAGQDEVLELTHTANSKDVFGVGALKAAAYIKDKPPGLYGMNDMMDSYVHTHFLQS